MKPRDMMTRLLAVHEEYLTMGARGPEARAVIRREFLNLTEKTIRLMEIGHNMLSQVNPADLEDVT